MTVRSRQPANTITSVAARAVIAAVARRGGETAPLFALVGLAADDPRGSASDEHLSVRVYFELWDAVMRWARDPSFAVRAGSNFDLEALEAFGFLAMSCETLADAYERTAPMRALYNLGSRWDLEAKDDTLRMIWIPWTTTDSSEVARRSANEYEVAEMVASVAQLTGRPFVPRRVFFRHAPPRDVEGHRAALGVVPEFDADFDGFEADRAWLDEPVRGKNPKLRAYFEKQCERLRAAFGADREFTALVRDRLAEGMRGGAIGMADVARSLGTSERSLQRRLADEGTRYAELLDQVRRRFAEEFLARPSLSVGEVAYLVGFQDSSAFVKAFRRWAGVTPTEYRHARASDEAAEKRARLEVDAD